MNRRTLLSAVGTISMIGLAGCQETVENLIEDADLPGTGDHDVSLGRTSATPGTLVEVRGVQDVFEQTPIGWLSDAAEDDPDDADRHLAPVDLESELLSIPPHPADYMGGGQARIDLHSPETDAEVTGLELEIEPLDPAPGTMSSVLDTLEAGLLEAAADMGYTRDELLAADPTELPLPVATIAAGLRGIGDEATDRTIRAIWQQEILDSDDDIAETVEVLEAMLAEIDYETTAETIAERFETYAATLDADVFPTLRDVSEEENGPLAHTTRSDLPALPLSGTTASASGHLGSPRRGNARSHLGRPRKGVAGPDVGSVSVQPWSPEPPLPVLDEMMAVQDELEDLNTGAEKYDRKARDLLIGGVALLPGGERVAGPAGLAAFWEGLIVDFGDGTLPRGFHDFLLDAAPRQYLEDEYDIEGKSNAGVWHGLIQADSDGWTFGWDEVADLLDIGPGDFVGMVDKYAVDIPVLDHVSDDVIDFLADLATEAFDVGVDSGPITVPPMMFISPVDPLETFQDGTETSDYVSWDLNHIEQETSIPPFGFFEGVYQGDHEPKDPALDLFPTLEIGETVLYEPLAVGVSELRLETNPDFFGEHYVSADPIGLKVDPIEVAIERLADGTRPNILWLDPQADSLVEEFEAIVEDAMDTSVEWELDVIEGPPLDLSTGGEDNRGATFDATGVDLDQWDRLEYVVEAESASEGGLRAKDDPPPRRDRVRIVVSDDEEEEAENLVVGPSPGCLDPDEAHELTATLDGVEIGFEELTWRIEGEGDGDITPDGTFVPSAEGEVYLEFWLDDDRDVTSELLFRVSEECTELTIQIDEDGSTVGQVYNCVMAISLSGPGGSGTHISTETRWLDGERTELRMEFAGDVFAQAEGEEATYTGGVTVDNVDDDATSGQRDWYPVPFTVTRTVEPGAAHDGTDLDVISGEFGPASVAPYGTVYGEFHGVGYGEDGCGQYVP